MFSWIFAAERSTCGRNFLETLATSLHCHHSGLTACCCHILEKRGVIISRGHWRPLFPGGHGTHTPTHETHTNTHTSHLLAVIHDRKIAESILYQACGYTLWHRSSTQRSLCSFYLTKALVESKLLRCQNTRNGGASHSSSSAWWMTSRVECLASSRRTPPSPPPTTSTFFGSFCKCIPLRALGWVGGWGNT